MELLLAALGMLACLAIMALLMPLGMRLVGRLRHPGTTNTPSGPPQPPQAAPPQPPPREHR